MLTAPYRSFSTLFLQDKHGLYFSNAFINSLLRYPLPGNRYILNNTPFFIDNNISRNPLYAELPAQVIPLSCRYPVMLSMNIRNHVIPRFFGRVLSGNKNIYNIFTFKIFLHRFHLFHSHFARTAPSRPKIDQNHLTLKFRNDGIK